MKTTRTKFTITATNIHTRTEYLVAKVVAQGDAFNILNLMQSTAPEYLTYKLARP